MEKNQNLSYGKPAVIVENKIIHATWKDHEYMDGYIKTTCSNCGWSYTGIMGWRSYYCPFCGAAMGDEDDNTAQNTRL